MTMMSTSHARLVPPSAKYIGNASMHLPSMLESHSILTVSIVITQNEAETLTLGDWRARGYMKSSKDQLADRDQSDTHVQCHGV